MPSNLPSTPRPAPAQTQPPADFGLVGWLERTAVRLPLRAVDCRFEVCGDLIAVEIDQVFAQNASRPLDCLYSFPLPGGAAVYRCELHCNGRMIAARVMERHAARQVAAEQKAAGRRTALVETERENLFTLSLGNLQSGDAVIVRFAYFQSADRDGAAASFHIPVCPGVRYIPGEPLLRANRGRGGADDTDQTPDASRLTPPRLDALDPQAAHLSVEGVLRSPLAALEGLSSPTHPVLVESTEGGEAVAVRLALGGAVPDRDFVLRWSAPERAALAPEAWVCRHEGQDYALAQVAAPRAVEPSSSASAAAQDIRFLVDRSGSMGGLKWHKAAEALRAFLRTLRPEDRVSVTFFESEFADLADEPMSPAALLAEPTIQNLEAIGVTGGTELLPALQHVLAQVPAGRRSTLIVLTDGQVGNEAEVLKALRGRPELAVHAIGIDTAVNDAFLRQMARQGRGRCFLFTPDDDLAGAVAGLGARLRQAALTDVALDESADGWQFAAGRFADLYAGEQVAAALRRASSAQPAEKEALRLTGRAADGAAVELRFALTPVGSPAPRLFWAKGRIDALLAEGQRAEAIKLAVEHNILCEGAAFIAYDTAERVPVAAAADEVYQPSLEQAVMAAPMPCMAPTPPMAGAAPARRRAAGLHRLNCNVSLSQLSSPPPTPGGSKKQTAMFSLNPLKAVRSLFQSSPAAAAPPAKGSPLVPANAASHPAASRLGEIAARWQTWSDSLPLIWQKLHDWRTRLGGLLTGGEDGARPLLNALCAWVIAAKGAARGERWTVLQEMETALGKQPLPEAKQRAVLAAALRRIVEAGPADDAKLDKDLRWLAESLDDAA